MNWRVLEHTIGVSDLSHGEVWFETLIWETLIVKTLIRFCDWLNPNRKTHDVRVYGFRVYYE